jgi:hypothetical protein
MAPQDYRRPTTPWPPFAPDDIEKIVPPDIATGEGGAEVAGRNAAATVVDDWTAGADNPIEFALTAWIGGLLFVEAAIATLDPRGRYLPPTIGF